MANNSTVFRTCSKIVLLLQVSTQLYVHAAGNPLLNYLKGLEADAVKSLTIVSADGTEAMNTFIHRLLGKPIFWPACTGLHRHVTTCYLSLLTGVSQVH